LIGTKGRFSGEACQIWPASWFFDNLVVARVASCFEQGVHTEWLFLPVECAQIVLQGL